mgnify:CR=1
MTPEERKAYNANYYQQHKGRLIDKRRRYAHSYWEENKDHLTEYNHNYYYRKKEQAEMPNVIIKTTGELLPSKPAGDTYTLDELQAIVGGYIEIVRLSNGRLMVLNEEGKLEGLPFNAEATALTRGILADDDRIVGNVLVCDSKLID